MSPFLGVIFTLLGLVAWAMTPLPVVPAMEILLGLTLLAAYAAGWPGGWLPPAMALALWAGTAVVEHLVRTGAMRRGGARKGSAWAVVAGSIAGLAALGPWGLPAGAFVGAFAWETMGGAGVGQGGRAGAMALVALVASGLGRFLLGGVIFAILAWTVWRPLPA
ncbi:DUF456 family protein [bacterium]|nr:DUF456 family protein [bacterium]